MDKNKKKADSCITINNPLSTDVWVDSSTYGNYTLTYTDSTATTITIPTQDDIDHIRKDVEAIKKRLAILDEPDAATLEKHKMLREAYNKYKMIEALIGKDSD